MQILLKIFAKNRHTAQFYFLLNFSYFRYKNYVIDPADTFQQMYIKLRKIRAITALDPKFQNSPMYELRSTEVDDIYYRYTENALYIPAAIIEKPFLDASLLKVSDNAIMQGFWEKYDSRFFSFKI